MFGPLPSRRRVAYDGRRRDVITLYETGTRRAIGVEAVRRVELDGGGGGNFCGRSGRFGTHSSDDNLTAI